MKTKIYKGNEHENADETTWEKRRVLRRSQHALANTNFASVRLRWPQKVSLAGHVLKWRRFELTHLARSRRVQGSASSNSFLPAMSSRQNPDTQLQIKQR